MTVQQPKINITFEELATSFITRSGRGSAVLIIKDDTNITFTQKIYKDITLLEADSALFTAENLQYIKDTMVGLPSQTVVIRVGVADTFLSGLALAEPLKTGWVGFVSELPADYDALATWNKQMKAKDYTFMSLEYKPTTSPNAEVCHTLINDSVVFKDARGEVTLEKHVPTMLGICAGSNVESGLTYKVIPNVVSVKEVADIDASLLLGNLVLTNDEGVVKVVLGINSLTTISDKQPEDFKYIEVIEINNLIRDDFRKEFKLWIGSHKNVYNQQILLISAFNYYHI
ncbi:phage tail sheath protein [Clostridium estertheticum]|uniref:phage tail sheath protein n=1 Tax=Clostridium estertheticum TaxID=238834 RepID=UPI001C0C6666|nr:phage tail sheath protein [Clostridium estertheticum]MBU3172764.1 phage tail sheath protein [Clostridium estertheticum]